MGRLRELPSTYGRTTLVLLAAILAIGFGLRAYRVVEPLGSPGDDAHAYYDLSKSLYEEGRYGSPGFRDASDWSPGAPLLYAASFYATGGAREGTARIVELLCGMGAIVVAFLLGARINCRPAGLIAAFCVAVYPPFIHSTGALFSEPPAILTLPAAVLAFLWAADTSSGSAAAHGWRAGGGVDDSLARSAPPPPRHPYARWLVPGVLFGLTALIRPEYLVVGAAFAIYALIVEWRARGWRPGVAATVLFVAAFLVPIVPWTVRNAIVLHRVVPISTGGGKALYVGTYLPADGDYQRVKALLAARYLHRELEPGSAALDAVDPAPLFDRVARRYPELTRDQALGRIGKEDLYDYLGEDPVGYAAMTVRKVGRMWSSGVGEAMSSGTGRAIQVLVVLLALAGLGVVAWRRRWWAFVAMATPIALVTAVGAVSLAAPRRNEILMTLVFPLAGTALARAGGALSSSGLWRSRSPASSPPN
jgi:Dolichyl-phosphate-mannose-protein mannosyltransferase